MKKTDGITLISLIITIIVMIILAGIALSFSVGENGIVNKTQTALMENERSEIEEIIITSYIYKPTASINTVGKLDLEKTTKAIYLNLTQKNFNIKTSTGAEAQRYEDIYTEGATSIILRITGKQGIYEGILEKNGLKDGIKNIVETTNDETNIPPDFNGNNELIPEGGIYKRIDGGTEILYNAGDAFPEDVVDGDIYIYEDYEYRYNYVCVISNWMDIETVNQSFTSEGISLSNGGWGVSVLDKSKTKYSNMLSSINGNDVINLTFTYAQCTNLLNTPELSSKTKDMSYTFFCCESLTTVSNLPSNVKNLVSTFDQCYSLINVSSIPSSVINMKRTFGCCESLLKAPDMSKAVNVTNMYGTFEECELLSGEIEINCNPIEYEYCFGKVDRNAITIVGTISETTKQGLLATARIK